MAGEITTGNQLDAYQGNAALGGSEASGYSKLDLSPLATYAAYAYNTHLEDYRQQQRDKTKLEELYTDPNIFLQLDKNYADQLQPLTKEFLESSKQSLYKQPNSDNWYKALGAHSKLVAENSKLKVVQDRKNEYKKLAEESADPHEKERLNAYIDKLDKYKLGEDVPAYDKYFKYNDAHIPTGLVASGMRQKVLPNGNIQNEKFTVYNPLNLDKQAAQNLVKDPTSAQTYSDIAHTFLQAGDTDTINAANKEAYDKSMLLNMGELKDKYKADFTKYQKQFPGKTFGEFMAYNGKDDELRQIYAGNEFLNSNDPKNQVQKIEAPAGENLAGFTYYVDPQTGKRYRMNQPDYKLGAMMGATKNVPGQKDEIVSEVLGLTPKDKFEAAKQVQIERENNAQRERDSLRDDATKRYIAELADHKAGEKAPELPMTPLPSIVAGIGAYNKRVKISDLPVSQIAAINPNWIDKTGQLKPADDIGNIEISVGTTGEKKNKADAVFVFNRKGKNQTKTTINESQLKSNAESWLAAFAKERKGQEVYGYIQDLYDKAKGTAGAPAAPASVNGLREKGNIDLTKQPSVPNPQTGGSSTVWSMSIGTDKGEVLISRVTPDGKILSEKEAIAYYNKTGKHLGIFDTPEAATKYAQKLHQDYESGKIKSAKSADELRKQYDY